MASVPGRLELRLHVTTEPMGVERLLDERRKAEDEALWQSTLQGGPTAVDLSDEGLARSAAGGAAMPKGSVEGALRGREQGMTPAPTREPIGTTLPAESSSEVLRDREMARLHEPDVRKAVSAVLRTLTGVGLDELDAAVVRGGTLPPAIVLKMLDPVGNTAEELTRREAQKAGLPPELTEKVATSAGLLLGILYPAPGDKAGKAAKAVKGGKTVKDVVKAGPDPRVQRLRRIFMDERGALIPDPAAMESRLNIGRVDAPDPVKELMAEVNRQQSQRLAGHRAVQTHESTIAASQRVFPTLEEALAAPVEDLVVDKAKALRFRDYYNAVGRLTHDLALRQAAGDPDATAKLPDAFALLAEMAIKDEKAGAGAARSLEARKILSDATRVDAPHLTRAVEQISGTIAAEKRAIEEITEQIANVKKTSGFAKAEADLERAQAKVAKLQEQLDAAEESKKAAEQFRTQIADEKKVAEGLRAEIKAATTPTGKLEADLDRAMKATEALEQKLADALDTQKAAEGLTTQIADEKKLAKDLKEQIGAIREETPNLEVLEARLLRSQELIEELTGQLRDAKAAAGYAMSLAEERGFNVQTIAELRRELRGVADADVIARRLLSLPRQQHATFAKNVIRYLKTGNDVVHWAFLQSLLSGPGSHAANILGTGSMQAWHIPERYLAEWIHLAFRGGPDGVQRGETAAMLRATGKGLSDGVRLLGHTLRSGEIPLGTPGRIETRFDVSAAQFGWDPTTPLGKIADVLGMMTPTRLMMSEDALYKGFAHTTEMAALALRQAMSEYPDLTRPGALDAMRRRVTMLEQVPTPEMVRSAKEAAALRTLNADLGPGGSALMTARAYLPGMSFLFPFVRTPINAYKWFHHRAPVLNLLSVQNWSDIAAGGAKRDLAVSRMLLGSAVAGAVAYHVLEGNITGGMAAGSSKNLKRDLKALGPQPYSLRVEDEYFYYKRTDPVGQYIGAIATAIEIYSQLSADEQDDFDWPAFAAAAGLAGSRVALDTPWLQGMSHVLDAIEKPDEKGKALLRNFAQNLVPAGAAQLTKSGVPGLADARPELKDLDSLVDALKARSFAFADDVPPVLHPITGDLVVRPPGWGVDMISPIYVTQRVNDPVLTEIITNRMSFDEPSRTLTGSGDADKMRMDPTHVPDAVKLNTHQYHRLKTLATKELTDGQGRTLHEAMTAEVASENYQRASRGPDGGRELRLKIIYAGFYERARKMLRDEDGDLDRKFREQRRQRLERLRSAPTAPAQPDPQQMLRNLTNTLRR